MKDGFKDTLGKTISGAITAKNKRSPNSQLFLTFTDNTYFEIWGDSFNCAGGVDPGGKEKINDYVKSSGGNVVTTFYEPNVNKNIQFKEKKKGINKKQKLILIIASIVVLLMLIFPPFMIEYKASKKSLGHSFIFSPKKNSSAIVNTDTLYAQWVGVFIISGLIIIVFKE